MPQAKLISPISKQEIQIVRVAAYCRVSSNSADQLNSYATQIKVYTKMIKNKSEWEMVDIFADEGISGLSAEKRPEFQRMIRMCELRQIDLIITKSVSRFARNVKEALSYVRKLKLLGVGVQFEKEGINTLSLGDEMLLNTFAAIAQEESKAISQNLRLSIVKRMASGEYVSSSAPYGFQLVNKELQIYEPEAIIVRQIFDAYLNGHSTLEIARGLTEKGITTKQGTAKWAPPRISYILSNEKYIGDSLFQKKFRDTDVPFKQYINRGQEDMFYVQQTHAPLIDKETFDKVQTLLHRRKEQFGKSEVKNIYPLTSRIRCSECGSFYRRKVRAGVIKWACSKHQNDTKDCDSFYYSEERIYDGFLSVINKLRFGEENILGQVIAKLETVAESYKRNSKTASRISTEIAELNAKLLMLQQLNSKGYLPIEVYQAQSREIQSDLNKLKTQRQETFQSHILKMLEEIKKLKKLIDEIEEPLEKFDEELFRRLVDDITINNKDEMTVMLIGGLSFTELI